PGDEDGAQERIPADDGIAGLQVLVQDQELAGDLSGGVDGERVRRHLAEGEPVGESFAAAGSAGGDQVVRAGAGPDRAALSEGDAAGAIERDRRGVTEGAERAADDGLGVAGADDHGEIAGGPDDEAGAVGPAVVKPDEGRDLTLIVEG